MQNEYQLPTVNQYELIDPNDTRIFGRPFGRFGFGFGRPFGFGFGRPFGFYRPFWGAPFLGGVLGGLLAGSLAYPYYGYPYPYYPYYPYY